MAFPDPAGSVARSGGTVAHSTDAAGSAARSTPAQAAGHASLDAGSISARLDRLPATRSVWRLVVLLSLGFFFELYDLLYSGYIAPGLVKSGMLTATTHGLFGSTGVASFIAALFSGLFIGTIACGFLADRFGRRAVFTWSLLWYTAAKIAVTQYILRIPPVFVVESRWHPYVNQRANSRLPIPLAKSTATRGSVR
ncbi:hypothetical protein OKW45_002001 [Paraburkholderia sp. WSM4175]